MRITIIGGGPGGYTAAFHAAESGCDVTLVEANNIGGTCLNRGCIPTKTLRSSADALTFARRLAEYGVAGGGNPAIDLDAVHKRKDKVVSILRNGLEKSCSTLGVRLLQGMARLVSAGRVTVFSNGTEEDIASDAVIIATGSEILELPGLAFDHKYICSSDDALDICNLPQRLLIVGGGVIGCELAGIFRAFGSNVTIVEGQDRLLPIPSVDNEVSNLLNREFRKLKINVLTGKTLQNVHIDGDFVRASIVDSTFVSSDMKKSLSDKGEDKRLEADMVLVTVGRRPSTNGLGLEEAGIACDNRGWIAVDDKFETSVPGVYAIGDVLGPSHTMLAHVATMEGICVVDGLMGKKHVMNYNSVPSAIFTTPEIGEVGLSEQQARNEGLDVVCGSVLMRELGKAHAMAELPGFFKLVADAATGRLLGVHIMGAHASDLVAEAGLALATGCTVEDIANTIHAHPTLAEGVFEAAQATLREMAKRN